MKYFLLIFALISFNCEAEEIFPDINIAKEFFDKTDVSISPVYGVFKGKDDHVATIHGFVDNLENCEDIFVILNKGKNGSLDTPGLFNCIKLNEGTLKH